MDSGEDTHRWVGCPIRRSRDRRSLASPPGFSQRAASFIASQCQGIHQMPFSALERHSQRQQPDIRCRISEVGTIGAAVLFSQKTFRAGPPRNIAVPPPPARSHNSLLHICPSAHAITPRTGMLRRQSRGLRAASAGSSPDVEVIGLEPTTPCLQSRCSPS